MKRIKSIAAVILMAAMMMTLFAGCVTKSADELYSLPQFSERYLQLQKLINGILGSGAEYAAPVSGTNRQAVQMEDIDGDDVKEAMYEAASAEKKDAAWAEKYEAWYGDDSGVTYFEENYRDIGK